MTDDKWINSLAEGDAVSVLNTDTPRRAKFVGFERNGQLVRVRFPWQNEGGSALFHRRFIDRWDEMIESMARPDTEKEIRALIRPRLKAATSDQLRRINVILDESAPAPSAESGGQP